MQIESMNRNFCVTVMVFKSSLPRIKLINSKGLAINDVSIWELREIQEPDEILRHLWTIHYIEVVNPSSHILGKI